MSEPLRVLIVEDSENDATLLEIELQRVGFEPVCHRVETADDMRAALENEEWDLVIADYVMPQFTGLAALKLVEEKKLDLPFIIVSGHITDSTAVAAMKAGAHDYVMKDNLARPGAKPKSAAPGGAPRKDSSRNMPFVRPSKTPCRPASPPWISKDARLTSTPPFARWLAGARMN